MLEAKNVLTIGIDYRVVRGGVAAVENVYSTFYKPFNHVATTIDGDAPNWEKVGTFLGAYFKFLGWMLFHPEIKIVHVHGSSGVSYWRKRIFINLAKSFGRKVVWHMHGGKFDDFSKSHHRSIERTLRHCDALIALSEYWKHFFETEFDYHHVVVVRNVIATPCLDKKSHDGFALLFLGLLGQNKGIFDLIEVLAAHHDEFRSKLTLRIGGNGEVKKLKKLIDDFDISDIVKYEGWVSGKKKANLMNTSDAYILPSYKEGLPISILEAMSYSLPIISTNVGGIPEILKNGQNGFIVEPGDKKAIYDAIKQMMNSKTMCENMGSKSKEMVIEHLPQFVEGQLTELYTKINEGQI